MTLAKTLACRGSYGLHDTGAVSGGKAVLSYPTSRDTFSLQELRCCARLLGNIWRAVPFRISRILFRAVYCREVWSAVPRSCFSVLFSGPNTARLHLLNLVCPSLDQCLGSTWFNITFSSLNDKQYMYRKEQILLPENPTYELTAAWDKMTRNPTYAVGSNTS
jgi:hypothetical protein